MGHRHTNYKTSMHVQFERMHSLYSGRIYNFVLKISHGNTYIAEEITQIEFFQRAQGPFKRFMAHSTELQSLALYCNMSGNPFPETEEEALTEI